MRRLRTIEAMLCGRHLVNRYHKLPDDQRFSMIVAFEGEVKSGDRHAHILAYVPPSMKRRTSHEMMIGLFPGQFRYFWATLKRRESKTAMDDIDGSKWFDLLSEPQFGSVTDTQKVYVLKNHRLAIVPWSRFDFVTPPKSKRFTNETLSVINNRNMQKRRRFGSDPLLQNNHVV